MEEERKETQGYAEDPFLARGCCSAPVADANGIYTCSLRCAKHAAFDWLHDLPAPPDKTRDSAIEVRFKNSRKDFFQIQEHHEYRVGDIVAVEASPGHDIGVVSLTGPLVSVQMKLKGVSTDPAALPRVYRRARNTDIDKWVQAIEKEERAKLRTRALARELGLEMKVNDVDFQGDNTKATFYYTADDRVDFRQLIRYLADEFRVRVEMRQIGVRQEASRVGGIGSCGRELCCSTWLTDFKSVTTQSARVQQLSLNPQKLAGQCGKLKCCLNYELEVYRDAIRGMPRSDIRLKSARGEAVFQKVDVFKKLMWYSYVNDQSSYMAIPADKVNEVISMNRKGQMPDKLEDFAYIQEKKTDYSSTLEEDDLTRFDD